MWFETAAERGQQTLAEFLAVELRVPRDEAEVLAKEVLGPWNDEWRTRGGADEAKKIGRITAAFVAAAGLLVVLACLAVALLIWFFLT